MARRLFEFGVVKHIGKLSDGDQAITKELNLISWRGAQPIYDLRNWKANSEGKEPLKGFTLSVEELKTLKALLNEMDLSENVQK